MQIRASRIRYLGTREEQQDNVSVFQLQPANAEPVVVGVLTDGVGGLAAGGKVSAFINDHVSDAIRSSFADGPDQDTAGLLKALAEGANDALKDYMAGSGADRFGTTLVIAVLQGGSLTWLSIGDSVLMGLTTGGDLSRLNAEHVAQQNGRPALSSAITGQEIAEIDTGTINIGDHALSMVLLSSDGIRTLPEDRLVEALQSDDPNKLRLVIDTLVEIDAPKQDNCSMILFELDD